MHNKRLSSDTYDNMTFYFSCAKAVKIILSSSEQIWMLNEMYVLTSCIVHVSCNNEFETDTELNGLNYQGC